MSEEVVGLVRLHCFPSIDTEVKHCTRRVEAKHEPDREYVLNQFFKLCIKQVKITGLTDKVANTP